MLDSAYSPLGFLLVLARAGGFVGCLPFGGERGSAPIARVILTVVISVFLYSSLPASAIPATESATLGRVLIWVLREAALGVCFGLLVACLSEALSFAAQIVSQQAGFSYASMIDPTNHTDTGVLPMIFQLLATWLFFALEVDRSLIELLGRSLAIAPPGQFDLSLAQMKPLLAMTGSAIQTAVRLSLPAVVILVAIDLGAGALARLQPQFPLLSVTFSLKSAICLVLLALLASRVPSLYRGWSHDMMTAAETVLKGTSRVR